MVVSLYKYDGILQLNSLVITGSFAAFNKTVIEWFQVKVAKGSKLLSWVWLGIESVLTMTVSSLISPHKV